MWVPEFGGVGPHDGGNTGIPEWRVITAPQNREKALESHCDLEIECGEVRQITAGGHQDLVRLPARVAICKQPDKIADTWDAHRKFFRDALAAWLAAGVADHFENVGNRYGKISIGEKVVNEVSAACEVVFLAIKGGEADVWRGG